MTTKRKKYLLAAKPQRSIVGGIPAAAMVIIRRELGIHSNDERLKPLDRAIGNYRRGQHERQNREEYKDDLGRITKCRAAVDELRRSLRDGVFGKAVSEEIAALCVEYNVSWQATVDVLQKRVQDLLLVTAFKLEKSKGGPPKKPEKKVVAELAKLYKAHKPPANNEKVEAFTILVFEKISNP